MKYNKVENLEQLETATKEDVFYTVKNHLLKQKIRSFDENGKFCLYRGPKSISCAAGCLMSQEEYEHLQKTYKCGTANSEITTGIEHHSWGHLVHHKVVPEAHSDLIQRLQGIHNNLEKFWEEELNTLEQKLGEYD